MVRSHASDNHAPEGESFAICGRVATGKSTAVDPIERKGTKSNTLKSLWVVELSLELLSDSW